MAEHTILRKSRNAFSSFLHVLLKVLLGVGSIFITLISGSPLLGIILVFMSKWRVFAVRLRFWPQNIKSNLVDILVGISFVLLAYISGTEFAIIHLVLAAFYALWLVYIKSKTTEFWILTQSLICIFFGSAASILLMGELGIFGEIFLTLFMLLVGYSAARHVFIQNSNYRISIISFTFALLAAEVAWICARWNIIYTVSSIGLMVPQFSIIITILAFALSSTLTSISRNDNEINKKEILPPIIFSLITVLVIIIFFSNPIFNI